MEKEDSNRMIEDDNNSSEEEDGMMIVNGKKRLHDDVTTWDEEEDGMVVGKATTTFATLSSRYMVQPNVVENYDDSECFIGGGGKRICGPYRECGNDHHNYKSYWMSCSWDNDDESNIVPNTMEEDKEDTPTITTKSSSSSQQHEEEIYQLMNQWTNTFDDNNKNSWARLNLKTIRNQYNHDTDTETETTTNEQRKQFLKNKRKEARRMLLKGITAL